MMAGGTRRDPRDVVLLNNLKELRRDRGPEGSFLYDVNAHSWVWSDPGGFGISFFLGKMDHQKHRARRGGSRIPRNGIEKLAPMGSILGVIWGCFGSVFSCLVAFVFSFCFLFGLVVDVVLSWFCFLCFSFLVLRVCFGL